MAFRHIKIIYDVRKSYKNMLHVILIVSLLCCSEHSSINACSYQATQELIDGFEKYKSKIMSVKMKREGDKRDIHNDKTKIQTTIEDLRRKLNEQLDFLEGKALDELDLRFRRAEERVSEDISALDQVLFSWKTVMDDYVSESHLDGINNTVTGMQQLLADMKLRSDKAINKAKHNIGNAKIDFVKDINLASDQLGLKSFGTFVEPSIEEFYAVYHGDYEIDDGDDEEEGDLTSCCVLPDGSILVVDSVNAKVKKLDDQYHVSASCVMPDKPCDTCVTDEHEVVVSIPRCKQVQFVDTRNDMKLKDAFHVGHPCFNVDYYDGRVYVTYDWPKQISVYKRDGTWVQTFRKFSPTASGCTYSSSSSSDISDPSNPEANNSESSGSLKEKGKKLFRLSSKTKSKPEDRTNIFEQIEEILVCPTSQTIYACDVIKGLVMIKNNGQSVEYIHNFKGLPSFAAKRICRGVHSDFFLFGKSDRTHKSAMIHIERHKSVTVMEGDEDFANTVAEIEAMSFDRNTNRMIVTLNGCSHIRVFQIT